LRPPGTRSASARRLAKCCKAATLREAQLGTLARLTRLALAVGAVVLALAAMGLYGAVSFCTSQRRREIAIRAALGAPRRRVLRVVAREAVAVVAAGALLGLLLSAIAFRYMSGMLFAQWTLDPVLVGGVTAVFAVTYIPHQVMPSGARVAEACRKGASPVLEDCSSSSRTPSCFSRVIPSR
jgi:predicted lysophospholipase L1 biosynthesis ABC-type transport system permease subunit